jgi:hypothetical protein
MYAYLSRSLSNTHTHIHTHVRTHSHTITQFYSLRQANSHTHFSQQKQDEWEILTLRILLQKRFAVEAKKIKFCKWIVLFLFNDNLLK